jgi:hypothetical protein
MNTSPYSNCLLCRPVEAIQDSPSEPAASGTSAENLPISQSLNEPIKEFKKIIEMRNKGIAT